MNTPRTTHMSRRLSLLILTLIGTVGLAVIRLTMAASTDLFVDLPLVRSQDRRLQGDTDVVGQTTGTRQLKSPALGLQMTYPADWYVLSVNPGQTVRYLTNEAITDPAALSPEGVLLSVETDETVAESASAFATARQAETVVTAGQPIPTTIDGVAAVVHEEAFTANGRSVVSVAAYAIRNGQSFIVRLSAHDAGILAEHRVTFDSFLLTLGFLSRS